MIPETLIETEKRRIFRAAFDIAASVGLDLDDAIDLARTLTAETLRRVMETAEPEANSSAPTQVISDGT